MDKKEFVSNLQNDRAAQNYFNQQHDERMAKLAEMDPANSVPALGRAPCVRIKATGMILPWHPDFAARPDLVEDCDENGNTDPASWGATFKAHDPAPAQGVAIVLPKDRAAVHDEHTSPVGLARERLGVGKEFSVDYTSELTRKESLVIPEQAPGTSVTDVVDATLSDKVGAQVNSAKRRNKR